MMQALATEMMTALRRAIQHLKLAIERIRWHRRAPKASRELAHDLGLPTEVVSRVLDQAAADLRKLALKDDACDARPIINKAVDELAKLGVHSTPFDDAAMERCLKQLPERDLTILRHFKRGMKHSQIAALMGTDVESVRRSLVKTYADLRIKMMSSEDGDGGAATPDNRRKRVHAVGRR